MERDPLVNIVLPVYNEELRLVTSLPILVDYLQRSEFPYRYLITIVDNGSADATLKNARHLAAIHPHVVAVSIPEKGKGRAVREGWKSESGVMAFMDIDLATDLSHFRPLIDAVACDGFDVSIGNRLGTTSLVESRRFTRAFFSKIFNTLVRAALGSAIVDHQCGFKAIRADRYRRIEPRMQEDGFFFDTELLVLAQKEGFRICSIDVQWRDDRDSKVSLFKTSGAMLKSIYSFKRRLPPV